jgi:hypothetical protein
MNQNDFKKMIQLIVKQAINLKDQHVDEKNAPLSYVCIFSQRNDEYSELVKMAKELGKIIEETPTGLLFQISPMQTPAGVLQLLKIRVPDSTRPERGDADFSISNYSSFKTKYLSQQGFKLIKRKNYEMIELVDANYPVRVYFPNVPLDKELGLNK